MREMKFRGKTLISGNWKYGDLVKYNATNEDETIFCIKEYDSIPIEVDPKTVGQYTGLGDNSGYEIYEGDIVEVYDKMDGKKRIIQWHEKKHGWAYKILEDVYTRMGKSLINSVHLINSKKTNDIDIVGNIHDTPELLNDA